MPWLSSPFQTSSLNIDWHKKAIQWLRDKSMNSFQESIIKAKLRFWEKHCEWSGWIIHKDKFCDTKTAKCWYLIASNGYSWKLFMKIPIIKDKSCLPWNTNIDEWWCGWFTTHNQHNSGKKNMNHLEISSPIWSCIFFKLS